MPGAMVGAHSSPKNAKEIYKEVLEKNLFREATRRTQSKVLSFASSPNSPAVAEGGLMPLSPVRSSSRGGSGTSSPLTSSTTPSSYLSPAGTTPPRDRSLNVMYSQFIEGNASRKHRSIPSEPTLMLDVPNFQDNFYLNLLDWSSDDVISIAAGKSVYLYDVSKVGRLTNILTSLEPVEQH